MPTERCTPRTRAANTRVAAQLAIEDNAGDDKDREHQRHQQQHLPGHDRLRDTMVRIVTIPVVSIPTAIAKTRPPLRFDEQRVEVVRVDDRESAAGEHRQGGKNVNAGARLGCQGARVLAQCNPLADDLGQSFQRLADRAAGLALQRESGGEEAIFGQLISRLPVRAAPAPASRRW